MTKDDVTKDDVTKDDVTKDDVTKAETDDVTKTETKASGTTEVTEESPEAREITEPTLADEEGDEDAALVPVDDGPLRHVLVPAVLVLVLLASAGLTAWLYFGQYRPDQALGQAAKTEAIRAASDGTVSLLSYSPDTLDKDFANAKTHLTGDFLNYYTQFTAEIVTPAAKQKQVKTSAAVVRSALVQLQQDRAEVLLFINQTTTSKENPAGSFTASSVKVGLTKVGGNWLIDKFDPV